MAVFDVPLRIIASFWDGISYQNRIEPSRYSPVRVKFGQVVWWLDYKTENHPYCYELFDR